MRSQHHRSMWYGTLAAALLLGAAAAVPAAADPGPVGPGQYFTGQVNGASEQAVIQVVCAGPVGGDRTGHAVAGQSVSVAAVSPSTGSGFTGESADEILVDFGGVSTGPSPVALKSYDTKAEIPSTQFLPCAGTGEVVFTPAPASATARPSTVTVTYESIAD